MLARLSVPLDFDIALSRAAMFPTYTYKLGEYEVLELPPNYVERESASDPAEVRVNTESAVLATILRIDFRKDAFERRVGLLLDPPMDLMEKAVDSLLLRLRHVTGAHQVRHRVIHGESGI